MAETAIEIGRSARTPATPLKPVEDPACWTAEDLARDRSWLFPLSDSDIAELDAHVEAIERRGLGVMDITRDDIDLPTLAPRLRAVRDQVIEGKGLALVRGVPVGRYSRLQSAIAFWSIGLFVGDPVSQNAKGHLLGHVQDLGGTTLANPKNRGYQTHEGLPFHSDSCDVVALLCLHPSKSGGESTVVSSIAIYNEMVRTRPELAAALAEPVYRDRRNEIPEGKDPWFQLPVFNFHEGYLTVSWQGGYIRSAARFDELPPQSDELKEALDMFARLARETCFAMDFQPGDIQLLHNHVVVHSRTEFEDYPEPERRRHLLRLWLATPDGRPISPAYRNRYGHLGPNDRAAGGIVVPGTVYKAPLEAE